MSVERLHARIAWLEAAVQQRAGEAIMTNDRIEMLEAALKALVIRCEFQKGNVRPLDFGVAVKNARAVLDKGASK